MTAPRLSASADAWISQAPSTPAAARPPAAAGTTAPSGADLVVVVYGTPGPQGSKDFKGMRTNKATGKSHAVLVESSAKVKPWRANVVEAAQKAVAEAHFGCLAGRWPMFDGPVAVGMTFTLVAPKRMPKGRVSPSVKPDLSKLLRSTEDALTDANVWTDDALVVEYRHAVKTYPGQHPDALDSPGAVIRIWALGGTP